MDGHGFDLLTKRFALLTTRRRGLRLALASSGIAGLLGMGAGGVEAACGGPGKRCTRGDSCCSGICLRGRKKKGKKGKKQGKCDCSFPQEACNTSGDCCFETSSCGDNGCDPDNRCCEGEDAECIDPCDCCLGFTCFFEGEEEFGQCVPCVALQDPCVAGVDFCCDDGTFCDSNGGSSGDVCCLDAGFECSDDLDCCAPRRCSSRFDNTCQSCLTLGAICIPQNNLCCDKDAKCFDNGCDQTGNRCCLQDGGSCESDCDCCEDFVCVPGSNTCQRDLGLRMAGADNPPAAGETQTDQAERGRASAKGRRSRKTSRKRRRRR